MTITTVHRCLNCQDTENERPLINLRYAGQPAWVCSRCLPVLIHHPEQVAHKLPGRPGSGEAMQR
jgi:hypothetical protein